MKGQIKSQAESDATTSLATDGISIIDFASPTVNYARNEPIQARLKETLINAANNTVINSIS